MANDSQYIHETVLKDIIDFYELLKNSNTGELKDYAKKNKSFRSSAYAAEKMTLVFPVLMSTNISTEAAGIVTKAIERKAVSIMQILFAAMNVTDANNAIDYVSNFHNNLNTNDFDMEKYLDDYLTSESAEIETTAEFRKRLEMETAVVNDAKDNTDFVLPDNVNDTPLNAYKFEGNSTEPIFIEESKKSKKMYKYDDFDDYLDDQENNKKTSYKGSRTPTVPVPSIASPSSNSSSSKGSSNSSSSNSSSNNGGRKSGGFQRNADIDNANIERINAERDAANAKKSMFNTQASNNTKISNATVNNLNARSDAETTRAEVEKAKAGTEKAREERIRNQIQLDTQAAARKAELDKQAADKKAALDAKNAARREELDRQKAIFDVAKSKAEFLKNSSEYFSKQLIPSDVKKANELVPTMMNVNFTVYDGNNPIKVDNVIIGIKAKMYPLDSADILNRIRMKNKDGNFFNKLIRATTREISFFKDFLFAIDKAKLDAISMSRKGKSSKLWKVLELRGETSRIKRLTRSKNNSMAISTLVMSSEEVEYLKKAYNIDVTTPSVMRPIMEAYNLMGVVLVDEANEVASFMFDSGDDLYEQISFNNLEREANDGSAKKIINLMTKIAR